MNEPKFKPMVVLSDVDPVGRPIKGTAALATPILDQNEYWVTQDREFVKLEEMTPGHRMNLIVWLERRAVHLFFQYQVQLANSPMAPVGDMATLAFERYLEEEFLRWHEDPLGWLEQTPFYQRLQWLIEQDRANGEAF